MAAGPENHAPLRSITAPRGAEADIIEGLLRISGIPCSRNHFASKLGIFLGDLGQVIFHVLPKDFDSALETLSAYQVTPSSEDWAKAQQTGDQPPSETQSREARGFGKLFRVACLIWILFGLTICLSEMVFGLESLFLILILSWPARFLVYWAVVLYLRRPEDRFKRYAYALAFCLVESSSSFYFALVMAAPTPRSFAVRILSLSIWHALGLGLFLVMYLVGANLRAGSDKRLRKYHFAVIQAGRGLVIMLLLVGCLGLYRDSSALPLAQRFVAESMTRSEFLLHNLVTGILMLLLCGYGTMRFMVIEIAMTKPILYLRSAGDEGAREVFNLVVAPVVEDFGVVATLQKTGDQSRAPIGSGIASPRPILREGTSENWNALVRGMLEVSAAVLIDATVVTPAVRWELEEAVKVGPRERVVVLWRGTEPPDIPGGLESIEYELEPRDYLVQSRENIYEWMKRVLLQGERVRSVNEGR